MNNLEFEELEFNILRIKCWGINPEPSYLGRYHFGEFRLEFVSLAFPIYTTHSPVAFETIRV